MKSKVPPRRRDHSKLGKFLKEARGKQSVEDVAKHLSVTRGFVYHVEQGKRKPKDSQLGQWASVYGMRPPELWKCLDRVPMDFVATLKEEPEPIPVDPFSQLTEEEKSELRPFLDFVRWKIAQQASKVKR